MRPAAGPGIRRRGAPLGNNLGDDLRFQVGEVEERVAFAGAGKIDQPDKPARPDQHIFQVQVAVDDGLGPRQAGGEQVVKA